MRASTDILVGLENVNPQSQIFQLVKTREEPNDVVPSTRSKSESLKAMRSCQKHRLDAKRTSIDSNLYNQGGLGSCCMCESANKLKESMLRYLNDNSNDTMSSAGKQLQVAQCGTGYDIFALDVY